MYRVSVCVAILGAGLLASAGYANPGVSFSFASDSNAESPTFVGSGFNIFDAGTVLVDLLVDNNLHDPGGVTEFSGSVFDFEGTIYDFATIQVGNYWMHMWSIEGSFSFGGGDQLTTEFNYSTLVSSLSPNPDTMGPTLTLQGSEPMDPGVQFTAGSDLNAIGIYSSDLVAEEAYAFTFTQIRNLDGVGLPHIDPNTGEFLEAWDAEGSYSAFATVPGPVVLSVIGLGLAVSGGRRRGA